MAAASLLFFLIIRITGKTTMAPNITIPKQIATNRINNQVIAISFPLI